MVSGFVNSLAVQFILGAQSSFYALIAICFIIGVANIFCGYFFTSE
jgi:H+/gluconate symporter-like permease